MEKLRVLEDNARLGRQLEESSIKTEQLEADLKNIAENRDGHRHEMEIRVKEIETREEERVMEMKKLEEVAMEIAAREKERDHYGKRLVKQGEELKELSANHEYLNERLSKEKEEFEATERNKNDNKQNTTRGWL